MNPRTIHGGDRLSHSQDGFHNALENKDLIKAQVFVVKRNTWLDRWNSDWRLRDKPMGLVQYVNENGQQYCTYENEVITINDSIF